MALSLAHAFVSAKPNGGDASLVQPADWNAPHALTLATQRAVGRNTAGAGAAEEVTASQIFDWVSATNGVLLTRTGGSWAAIANVATDNGDLVHTANASPVAPAAGKAKLHASTLGGRTMLSQLGSVGAKALVQPFLGQQHAGWWLPSGMGLTTITTMGMQAPNTATGTLTGRNPATTNSFTLARRLGQLSAAGAGSVAAFRTTGGGYVAMQGGFHLVHRFGISDPVIATTGRMFAGLWPQNVAPTDVDVSTLVNILGVGCDANDTVLQLYGAGAVAQSRTSLGANFPANTTSVDIYELALYCAPGATSVGWQVTRLNTGDTASGTLSGANVPAGTTLLNLALWRTNGVTAAACAFDWLSTYLETDI